MQIYKTFLVLAIEIYIMLCMDLLATEQHDATTKGVARRPQDTPVYCVFAECKDPHSGYPRTRVQFFNARGAAELAADLARGTVEVYGLGDMPSLAECEHCNADRPHPRARPYTDCDDCHSTKAERQRQEDEEEAACERRFLRSCPTGYPDI